MPRKADPSKRIVDAAMHLAGQIGWADLKVTDIAAEAGISVADVLTCYSGKPAILAAHFDRMDAAMVAGADADLQSQPVRDRLFDLIMRRLDAMAPHKAAIRNIARDLARDPVSGACASLRLGKSMALALEAAGLSPAGLGGLVQIKGLGAIYLATLRVWFRDESEDMSATMAALDKSLRRADDMMARLCRRSARAGSKDSGDD